MQSFSWIFFSSRCNFYCPQNQFLLNLFHGIRPKKIHFLCNWFQTIDEGATPIVIHCELIQLAVSQRQTPLVISTRRQCMNCALSKSLRIFGIVESNGKLFWLNWFNFDLVDFLPSEIYIDFFGLFETFDYFRHWSEQNHLTSLFGYGVKERLGSENR